MALARVEQIAARSEAIVSLAAGQLSQVWPRVDWGSPAAADAVSTLYGGIVTQFGQATAAVAATVYDELREEQGVSSNYVAEPADPFPQEAIDSAVRSAFLGRDRQDAAAGLPTTTSDLPVEQRVPARLEAGLQRRVMQPARATVAQNVAKDPVQPRYIRVPRGKSTCAFCILLASRDIGPQFRGYGAASVRTDPETGSQYLVDSNGERYHNGCDCEAIPLFGQRPEEVSPHFYAYRDLYEKAAAEAGTRRDIRKVLASMRRLTNDGAFDEDRPDVRDRAGEGNRRATPVDVEVQADDELDQPQIDDVTELDAAADRPDISDELDQLDAGDDDFAELDEPGPKSTETRLDMALRELEEAMESGDDERIAAAAELADQLEAEAQRAAERREQKKREIQDRIFALIEGGTDPAEAEAEVTGKSVESIRRRDFMAQARSDGHTGASFEKLLGSAFDTRADEAYWLAEAATNGFMLKRQYEGKVDPRQLWYVNETTARKYMSDEMAEWFDQNGRITRAILRDMVLSGSNIAQRHREDFLQ
jgi:hypothetical protein